MTNSQDANPTLPAEIRIVGSNSDGESPRIFQPVDIRWAITQDISAILEIDEASFNEPWTEAELREFQRGNRNVIRVAVLPDGHKYAGSVVGYLACELRSRSYKLANLAVHPEFRRQGIATQLIGAVQGLVIRGAMNRRRRMISEHVHERNLIAQKFFRSVGFLCVKIDKNAFEGGDSAYVMEWRAEE